MEATTATWGNGPRLQAWSLFREEPFKSVRLGNIAVIGSNQVNGGAAVHTEVAKKDTFAESYQWFCASDGHDKFSQYGQRSDPRRWIYLANRPLSDIYSKHLGSQKWPVDMNLQKRRSKRDNPESQAEGRAVHASTPEG